jgi:glycosyltransferase involved in cell wall biosynthesis
LESKRLHLLLISNTNSGAFIPGADRDWVNLLNALGPDYCRVTWVGNNGTQELQKYLDERVLVRTIDLQHPCFYELVAGNARTRRSKWLWTKILIAASLSLVRSLVQLRRALGRDPVDLVITNTAVVLLGAVFASLRRSPHVWTIKEYLDPQIGACRTFAKLITRFSSAVVVPSRVIGDAFESRLHVVPDGGDIENIRSRVRTGREDVLRGLGLPLSLPLVAQVGTISQSKGQYLTAEAFVKLAQKSVLPTFSLVFFGSGSPQEMDRLKLVISKAPEQWRNVVKFAVFEDGNLSALAAADIVAHPSTIHDSFPNAVREAMTLGRPVIASAMGGMINMIVDGDNGLLIPPDDPDALAAALEHLLQDRQLRLRLGERAELFARENFDIHINKLAYVELFNQLVTTKEIPVHL